MLLSSKSRLKHAVTQFGLIKSQFFEEIDVVIKFVIVSVFEEKFHLLLALLHLEKHIDSCVTERKGTERALVLGRVLEEELILLTVGSLYDHMFDRNRLILEVDSAPFKAADFLTSQVIIGAHINGKLKVRLLGYLE